MILFSSRHHKTFWNLQIIQKLEKLVRKNKKTLQEKGVENVPQLLEKTGVRRREVATCMIGKLTLKQEPVHRFFDPFTKQRNKLELQLKEAKLARYRLENNH